MEEFDHIIAMDEQNLRDLQRRKGGKGKVSMFGAWDAECDPDGNDEYDTDVEEIEDPYYGGDEGFEVAYRQCVRFSKGWVKRVLSVDVDVDSMGKVTVRDNGKWGRRK